MHTLDRGVESCSLNVKKFQLCSPPLVRLDHRGGRASMSIETMYSDLTDRHVDHCPYLSLNKIFCSLSSSDAFYNQNL